MTTAIPLLTAPVADDADTSTFAARARVNFLELNPMMTAANTLAGELNTLADNVATNTGAAGAAAAAAAASAAAAAATSTAANWVSGTTYAVGNVRRSLIDGLPYQRLTVGAGTTDPRDDKTNWVLDYLQIDTGLPPLRPSLLLDFANSGSVDSRVTFLRASVGSYFDAMGVMRWAPVDTPRITHDPVTGECLGLLAEAQAANMLLRSSDFGVPGVWIFNSAPVITANYAEAPDKSMTANRLQCSTSNSGCYQPLNFVSGTKYTCSVFIKDNGGSSKEILFGVGGPPFGAVSDRTLVFNIETMQFSFVSPDIQGYFAEKLLDGWIRLAIAFTPTVTVGGAACIIYSKQSGLDIVLWGSQVESGVSHPSSYIQTEATAVTRIGEWHEIQEPKFLDFYNQKEGTFVIDLEFSEAAAAGRYAILFDARNSAATDRVVIALANYGEQILETSVVVGGATTAYMSVELGVAAIGHRKIAISLKEGSYKMAVDGVHLRDTPGTPLAQMPTPNHMIFALFDRVSGFAVRSRAYYPRAATAAELMALSRI